MKDELLVLHMPPQLSDAGETADLQKIDDYYAWALEQARYLRTGRFDLIDLPNIIDEIEAVGRSELHAFRSNLRIVLTHLLEGDYQPQKRSRSWENSIGEHRDRIEENIIESASMMRNRDEVVAIAYGQARRKAIRETRLASSTFPDTFPCTWKHIMEAPYELNRD